MKVVMSTVPLESAETLALSLVEQRVAACVNILPKVTSVYRWQGKLHTDDEALLVVKTADERVEHLFAALTQIHPYDVPEIVALDVTSAHAPYADWVASETAPLHSE